MVDPVSLPAKRVSAARILVSSGLGLLFDAFDVGILSYVLVVLAKEWHLTHTVTGLVGSVSSLGMAVGSALAGLFADRFGRRSLFLVTILIYSLATGLSAFAAGIGIFFVLRFFVGLGLGGELPVATTYVLESSPDEVRARRVVFLESFWAVGSLAAALVSYFVIPASGWRVVFLIGAIPALYTIVLRFALPEAARYARLQRRSNFGESMRNIWSRKLGRRSLVASVVWFVMNYSYYGMFLWLPSVLYDKGYSLVHSLGYSLIMTLAQIPGYMTAAWIVERWGRKRTLVAAMILTALSALAFGFAWNTASLIVFGLLPVVLHARCLCWHVRLHGGAVSDDVSGDRHGLGRRLRPLRQRHRTVCHGLAARRASRLRMGVWRVFRCPVRGVRDRHGAGQGDEGRGARLSAKWGHGANEYGRRPSLEKKDERRPHRLC